MAASAIARVIINLISRHGITKGTQKARILGFNKSQVNKAIAKYAKVNRSTTTQMKQRLRQMETNDRMIRTAERAKEASRLQAIRAQRAIKEGRFTRAAQRRDMPTFGERKAYRTAMTPSPKYGGGGTTVPIGPRKASRGY